MDGQKSLVIEKPFPSFRLSLSLSDPHPYSHTQYNRHTQPLFKLKLATAFCLSLSPDSSFTVSFSFFLSLSFWIFLFLFQSFFFILFLTISFSVSISICFFLFLSLSFSFLLFLSQSQSLSFSFSLDSNTFTQSAVSNRLIFSYFVTNTKFLATIFPSRSSIHCSLSLLHTQTTIHTLSLSFDLFVIFLSYQELSRGDHFCYCTFLPFLAVVCYQLISIKKANR